MSSFGKLMSRKCAKEKDRVFLILIYRIPENRRNATIPRHFLEIQLSIGAVGR